MGEQEALFCFLDGLCGWAKIEFERHRVQDLPSTIAAVESLLKFKESPQRDKVR